MVEESFILSYTTRKTLSAITQYNFQTGMTLNKKIYLLLLYMLVAIIGFFAAKTFFDFITRAQTEDNVREKALESILPQLPEQPPALTELPEANATEITEIKKPQPPTLVLNGIVFSPDSSYALINNKIVKEGDKIEGVIVVRITQDGVELKDQDAPFKLSPK